MKAHAARVPAEELGTRETLVSSARELFRSQGYHATSIHQILTKAKVHSGSLYHFFKGKEHLLRAVLDEYLELLEPIVIQPILARDLPPLDRVWALLEGYRTLLLESGFESGCPIGNLALEVGEQGVEVRDRLAANFAGWRRWVVEWLKEHGAADTVAHETAELVLAVMEGGVMQARIGRSIEPFDAAVMGLKRYLDLLMEQTA